MNDIIFCERERNGPTVDGSSKKRGSVSKISSESLGLYAGITSCAPVCQ